MTDDPALDVLSLGNAIVDVIAHADDALLERLALPKGGMTLVDAATAAAVFEVMGPTVQVRGGGAANTAVGVASLGGRAGFVGKVGDDELGTVFADDIRSAGVTFDVLPAPVGAATGRCLVLVTPDAQRTMSTFLGVASELGPDDLDEGVVESAAVVFLEGFLWDPPSAREALRRAATVARAAGRRVAFTLSDSFLVDRHRDALLAFASDHVDVLFANETELRALAGVQDDDDALESVRGLCEVLVATRGADGSVVAQGDRVEAVPAEPVDTVVDTTGAGDLYAAGFLYAMSRGRDIVDCARLGGVAAAEVISHVGARPEVPLRSLLRD